MFLFFNNVIIFEIPTTDNVRFLLPEKQYEKSDFAAPTENNSQPINSLDSADAHKEGTELYNGSINIINFPIHIFLLGDNKECTQLLKITQDCLELGGSAGDLMLPVCTLYRVCRTCVCKIQFLNI